MTVCLTKGDSDLPGYPGQVCGHPVPTGILGYVLKATQPSQPRLTSQSARTSEVSLLVF